MAKAIFLNVDFDMQSKVDLSRLIDELGDSIDVIANNLKDGIYYVSMELASCENNPDRLIREYSKLFENMSIDTKELFQQCTKRTFDFGYENEPSGKTRSSSLQASLSIETVQTLARLNATIVVTTYCRLNGIDNDEIV